MHGFEIQHLQRHVRLDVLFEHRDRITHDEVRRFMRGGELDINGLGQPASELVFDALGSSLETVRCAPLQVWEVEGIGIPTAMRAGQSGRGRHILPWIGIVPFARQRRGETQGFLRALFPHWRRKKQR